MRCKKLTGVKNSLLYLPRFGIYKQVEICEFFVLQCSKDKIAWLMADLQGNTYEEECIDALNACHWDIPSAGRYIKLQKLAK